MPRPDGILPVIVGDENLLLPGVEGIEEAVGVFLALVEHDQVELVAVRQPRAKQSDRAVQIAEDETSEVAGEGLRPGADRHEVVVGTEVRQFRFDEPLLNRGEAAGPAAAGGNVGTHHAEFVHLQVVGVEHGGDLDPPVVGLERPVTMKQVEGERVILQQQEPVGVAVEILLTGRRRRLEGCIRGGHLPEVADGAADDAHVEERLLPDQWIVFLEEILRVGIETIAQRVRIVFQPRVAAAVPVPRLQPNPPTVFDGHEMRRLLLFTGEHAGTAGESGGRIHRIP